jgi:hypothetical protein
MDEQMSVEELKAALMAKDAMIAELEQKMKDMMEESDASLAGEMPEEMAEDMPEEEEPKPEMMACGTEPEKKKLSEEPVVQAMSEATLLSEINALRAKNNQLSERLEVIEAEKRSVERREAVSALLREGKVAPAEQEAVEAAWDQREGAPVFWKMFSERPAGFAVPLAEVGHGASGEELNRATLAEKVKALASEKSISFESALNLFREQNPDQYNSVFGA